MPCATQIPCSGRSFATFLGTDRLVRKPGPGRCDNSTSRKHFLSLFGGILGGQQGLPATTATLASDSGALHSIGGKAPKRSTLSDANRNRAVDLLVALFHELMDRINRHTRRAHKAAMRLIDATYPNLGKHMQLWFGLYQGKVGGKPVNSGSTLVTRLKCNTLRRDAETGPVTRAAICRHGDAAPRPLANSAFIHKSRSSVAYLPAAVCSGLALDSSRASLAKRYRVSQSWPSCG